MPERIQRRRTAGWRMPADAVYVGRPSRWGNPISAPTPDHVGRSIAVTAYREWLQEPAQAGLIAAIRSELKGKDLACWCPLDHPCHADELLHIANIQGER